jgi:tricorn protease
MKNVLLLVGLLLVGISAQSQTFDVYFTTSPTLTPNGQTILFIYESDLWKVATAGGSATRLTAMQGAESRPRVSPDGQWVAFTGTQNDNSDVYVMPINGGPIRQLTYHSTSDVAEGWSWDSQTIYFKSGVQNGGTAYTVSLNGYLATTSTVFTVSPRHQRVSYISMIRGRAIIRPCGKATRERSILIFNRTT